MRFRIVFIVIVAGLNCCRPWNASAQDQSLRARLSPIVSSIGARVGVAVVGIESGDTLSIDGSGKYPMQSVFKFPLALAVLHRVDEGGLSLDKMIHISKADLLPRTWSPMREKYPEGNVDLTLDEVLRFTVSQSDNNGCDILFRLMGGTGVVEKYIHRLGIKGIAIVATEEEMHKEWNVQYGNWCTPASMAQLLRKFYRGEVLSTNSTSYLRQLMEQTSTGPGRIRGLLPEGTVVVHKTGSSGANDKGLIAASNDVGVITLPDGNHVALAVFVSDATCEEKECENVIARIAKAVWDFSTSGK